MIKKIIIVIEWDHLNDFKNCRKTSLFLGETGESKMKGLGSPLCFGNLIVKSEMKR